MIIIYIKKKKTILFQLSQFSRFSIIKLHYKYLDDIMDTNSFCVLTISREQIGTLELLNHFIRKVRAPAACLSFYGRAGMGPLDKEYTWVENKLKNKKLGKFATLLALYD